MKSEFKIIKGILIFLIFGVFFFSGCKKEDSKLSINGPSAVNIGGEITLTCKYDSEVVENSLVTWTTSDEKIATVKVGVVQGISDGTVTIKASYNNETAELEVKVVSTSQQQILKNPEIITENIQKGEKVELALYEQTTGYIENNYNPYDYSEINVFAVFKSPTGKEFQTPAFWYRDYTIELNTSYTSVSGVEGTASINKDEPQGLESVVWKATPKHYRFRATFDEVGKWNYNVYVEINGTIVQCFNAELTVNDGETNNKGIIAVDKTTNRNFVYGDGSTFIPIGLNLGWWTNNSRKTYDYDVWFEKLNGVGGNMCRIWLAPWGFCLHWGKSYNNFDSRLNMAARLDKVIDLADFYDIYIELTLLNHGQFATSVNPTWDQNPYNINNGGIISRPDYFFSNAECKKAYKNELLYIIGRYGYSDKIMAWELFNEVDWTDNAESSNALNIYNWHREMSKFLKDNDPYNHMVTTSHKYYNGMSYKLNNIDFINPHDYGFAGLNINAVLPGKLESSFATYNKPVFEAEIGLNYESGYQTYLVDKNGVSIRQSTWAGFMGGGCGGAMQWWWESWIHPYNLYYQFEGASKFSKMMDLTGGEYHQLQNDNSIVLSESKSRILGLKFENRCYGYLYNIDWTYQSTSTNNLNTTLTMPLTNGEYEITFYNAMNGNEVKSESINVTNSSYTITVPTFNEDLAFKLIKKGTK